LIRSSVSITTFFLELKYGGGYTKLKYNGGKNVRVKLLLKFVTEDGNMKSA
jgi:hypothetical protein